MKSKIKKKWQLHNEEWKKFNNDLKNIESFFDSKYFNIHKVDTVSGYKIYLFENEKEKFNNLKSYKLQDALFFLPLNNSLLNPSELVSTPSAFPVLPAPPQKIVLTEKEYPDDDIYILENDLVEYLEEEGWAYDLIMKYTELYDHIDIFSKIRKEKMRKFKILKSIIEKKRIEYEKCLNVVDDYKETLNGSIDCKYLAEKVIYIANYSNYIPSILRNKYDVFIDEQAKTILIEFDIPDFSENKFISGYAGTKTKKPKFLTENQKKIAVKKTVYSLMIRSAYLAAFYKSGDFYENVSVNVKQEWFDKATGKKNYGTIASMYVSVEEIREFNLEKIDPEVCFRRLKALVTPSFDNISEIKPIFVLNKNDKRLVPNKDVDSDLLDNANLASMDWEDFEHLVAQLFEWEFSQKGVEVKVTRASRDRGVDAIVFDPDPLRGGKYVLQAKRYTRAVDVSSVRDLYGTILNEGANRGILITTSYFGPDAYEFSKDKPISLVDGQNLLIMLERHGRKYRIDLDEARQIIEKVGL